MLSHYPGRRIALISLFFALLLQSFAPYAPLAQTPPPQPDTETGPVQVVPAQSGPAADGPRPGVSALASGAAFAPGTASPVTTQAPAWYDSLIAYSVITNCVSIIQGNPYQEYGSGAYVGYLADTNAYLPAPGSIYYIHLVIYGLGNPCSGTYVWPEISLPANTSLAVDTTNKVYCFYDGVALSAAECTQSLPVSGYHGDSYAIPSSRQDGLWPLAQGHNFEFQIPVRTCSVLSNSPFHANFWTLDGNSSPWLQPQQGAYVFAKNPTVTYPNPSTLNITASGANSYVYLDPAGLAGTLYFDLGLTTGYGFQDPASIPAGNCALSVSTDWLPYQLVPNTTYHFRSRFVTSTGITYTGADQTFKTLVGAVTWKKTFLPGIWR